VTWINERFQRAVSGRKKYLESVECFHIDGSSASHHNVVVFVEFNTAGGLREGVTKIVIGRDVRIGDSFFFSPLEDDEVFHVDMSCASCWLSRVGELSCAAVVGEDFCG
jgi:hypothetical protein